MCMHNRVEVWAECKEIMAESVEMWNNGNSLGLNWAFLEYDEVLCMYRHMRLFSIQYYSCTKFLFNDRELMMI